MRNSYVKTEIIPPGVDVPPSVRTGPPTGHRTLITVARLTDRYKGHDTMLRALPLVAARIPDVRWVVVGDGPLKQSYERAAAALGVISRLHFAGEVSDAERDRLLDASHVFVMVSRLSSRGAGEGFGIVYLEAGAHGLPVVGGRGGGVADAVADGETGHLVDPDDHVAVAGAIHGLLIDPENATRMGTAGRRRAEAHAWPVVAAKSAELLERVARAR